LEKFTVATFADDTAVMAVGDSVEEGAEKTTTSSRQSKQLDQKIVN
jgi:ABC-type dipeptide/oligopeptide/nickel transport system ATPase component